MSLFRTQPSSILFPKLLALISAGTDPRLANKLRVFPIAKSRLGSWPGNRTFGLKWLQNPEFDRPGKALPNCPVRRDKPSNLDITNIAMPLYSVDLVYSGCPALQEPRGGDFFF